MRRRCCSVLILMAVLVSCGALGDHHAIVPPGAKLPMVISIGWSSPDPRYLGRHIDEWEKRPFTGTLVNLSWPTPAGGSVEMATGKDNIGWQVFQGKRLDEAALRVMTGEMRYIRLRRSKDNFLWVVSYLKQGHFDWYDEDRWEIVLHNIERMARLARQGGLRGIVLDCEEYGCPFWSWGGSRPAFALKSLDTYKDRTWEETRKQVRERGRSFIRALNQGYPGCPIWTLYGYSHIEMKDDTLDLSDSVNGLYAAFFDGMLEASDEETIFIDGGEGSYRFSEPEEFAKLRKVVTEKALKYTMVPEIYPKKVRVGFGLYLDMFNYAERHPWYPDRPEDNYMPPDRLERALRHAIEASDGYVWVYTEYPSWWLDNASATFGPDVRSRDDHSWIDPVYWKAIENALSTTRKQEKETPR